MEKLHEQTYRDIASEAPRKRGPKPLGDRPMTVAERKRRSREQIRATGAKEFLVRVEGLHLARLEKMAESVNVTVADAFRQIMDPMLDRFAGIMARCERMSDNGASDQAIAEFMRNHLFPPLPPIEGMETVSENN
ncbi:hypothetical protein [Noviherbaspirillum sp.]|uniref:hypothetical protein n=1 Tax=Noviherbaspirillum sp. TaxID=1926288 RepID=UPI002B4A9D8D|nr:hypothetical protein [Noviherbaspirillum sp.]HJV82465.1 hypothetical protein [Noviherbaspirillum sp.]